MSRYTHLKAVIINKRKRGEGDLSLTVLTQNLGKINCLAKGAQSLKSHRLGHLEIGNIVKLSLYQKNSFYWISESESLVSFLHHSDTLIKINLLFYFLEILNALIPFDQSLPELFPIVVSVIESINQNNFPAFINNEIKFLTTLGYGLPPEITNTYHEKNYKLCQSFIKKYCESIIEKPLYSNKLFK